MTAASPFPTSIGPIRERRRRAPTADDAARDYLSANGLAPNSTPAASGQPPAAPVPSMGQPMVMISFHQLIREGGKEGARESFERLIAQLVLLQYPGVKRIEAHPGDWGLDVIAGDIDDVLSVWQAKFFIDGIGDPQKAQIREAFSQVMAKATEQGFIVDVWTLCIPVDLHPGALTWWTNWKRGKQKECGVRIELMARTDLEALLIAPDAAGIRAAFFPPPRPWRHRPRRYRRYPRTSPTTTCFSSSSFKLRASSSSSRPSSSSSTLRRSVAKLQTSEWQSTCTRCRPRGPTCCPSGRTATTGHARTETSRRVCFRTSIRTSWKRSSTSARQRAHRGATDAPPAPQGRHAPGCRERTSRLDPRLSRRCRGPACLKPRVIGDRPDALPLRPDDLLAFRLGRLVLLLSTVPELAAPKPMDVERISLYDSSPTTPS